MNFKTEVLSLVTPLAKSGRTAKRKLEAGLFRRPKYSTSLILLRRKPKSLYFGEFTGRGPLSGLFSHQRVCDLRISLAELPTKKASTWKESRCVTVSIGNKPNSYHKGTKTRKCSCEVSRILIEPLSGAWKLLLQQ